jgi:hypothetical protein
MPDRRPALSGRIVKAISESMLGRRAGMVCLTMTAAFVCLGCVDLEEPWVGAAKKDAGDTGASAAGGANGPSATTTGGASGPMDLPPGMAGSGGTSGGADATSAGSGGAAGALSSSLGGTAGAGANSVDAPVGDAGGAPSIGQGGTNGNASADGPVFEAAPSRDGANDPPSGAGGGGPAEVGRDTPLDSRTGGRGGSGVGGAGTGGAGSGGAATGGAATGGAATGGVTTGSGGSAGPDAGTDGGLAAGLVAYYTCDQANSATLPDSSGHGNDGTLASGGGAIDGGTAYGFGKGALGNALLLSAANKGYLSAPAGLLASNHEMTIAVWVYLNSNPSWQRIFDFGKDQNVDMVLVSNNSGTGLARFAISLTGPSGAQLMDAPSALPLGTWTHVAVVLGTGGGFLYVGGQQVAANASMSLRPADLGSTPNNYFGRSQYASDPFLDGDLDDIRIYDRALTAAEILALASGQQ